MTTEQAYIEGFMKRASEHGFNQKEASELLKCAFGDEDGPYRQEQAAKMIAAEQLLKAMRYNKEKHPMHYYLNPFVGGPVTEALTRLQRRSHASGAGEHGGLINTLGGFPGAVYQMAAGDDSRKEEIKKMFKAYAAKADAEKYM